MGVVLLLGLQMGEAVVQPELEQMVQLMKKKQPGRLQGWRPVSLVDLVVVDPVVEPVLEWLLGSE